MPLHMVKLAVGVENLKTFRERQDMRLAHGASHGFDGRHVHVTRMMPKRDAELLDGGSLYWVIRGEISARQQIVGLESFRDSEGISRCRLVLDPDVVAVSPRAMRPFQGWRYLTDTDRPRDLGKAAAGIEDMPETMRRELRELGLL